VKFHGWVKRDTKKNVNQVNLDSNTKEKSRQLAGPYYKEFSHVNGPKDQAGGCLADLLFYFMGQIYRFIFSSNFCPFFLPKCLLRSIFVWCLSRLERAKIQEPRNKNQIRTKSQKQNKFQI
jgi:hypothetical protein